MTSPLSPTALRYTLSELARRVGWPDNPAMLPITYGLPTETTRPTIFIIPAVAETWQALLTRSANSLTQLPATSVMPVGQSLLIADTLPVLFWGQGYEDGHKPFAEQLDNGSIIFYADIIAATFFMLSRWEETVLPERDLHDRFPATASVAYKQDFLDRPIVDEYALVLQAWLKVLLPAWDPVPHQFQVKLSHDIDEIRHFSSFSKGIRTAGHHLIKRRNLSATINALTDTATYLTAPTRDSTLQAINYLGRLSHQYNFESAFYFKSSPSAPFDSGYNPADPLLQPIFRQLQTWGFELGFHPGYYTYNNCQNFMAEKERLEQILNIPLRGGRQHYLRFQVPLTWRLWEEAGFEYDSTLGYADYEGFRAGTCHPYQVFDVEENRVLDLLELPLIVMDTTLKQYRQFTPTEGYERILVLARRCRAVGGTFTLLWHNTSFTKTWLPWAKVYESLLSFRFL